MRRSVSSGLQPSKAGKGGNLSADTTNLSLSSSQSSVASASSTSGAGGYRPKFQTGTSGSGGSSRSGSLSSANSGIRNRPTKAPPPPPTTAFKSTQKLGRPRDSLGTAHSAGLKKVVPDPKSQVEVVESMRRVLQDRLGTELPQEVQELAVVLSDGVHLCNFVNQVRIRAVPSVHSTSSTMPTLSTAKCRRNVENFLMACRRLGVPEGMLEERCGTLLLQSPINLAVLAPLVVFLGDLDGQHMKDNSAKDGKVAIGGKTAVSNTWEQVFSVMGLVVFVAAVWVAFWLGRWG